LRNPEPGLRPFPGVSNRFRLRPVHLGAKLDPVVAARALPKYKSRCSTPKERLRIGHLLRSSFGHTLIVRRPNLTWPCPAKRRRKAGDGPAVKASRKQMDHP